MPPKTSSQTPVKATKPPPKAHGTDIRGFFGAKASSSTPSSQPAAPKPIKTLVAKPTIEISDDDDDAPPARKPKAAVKPAAGTPQKKPVQAPSESSSPMPTLKRKKVTVVNSSSDEDEPTEAPPRKKAAVDSAPKASSSKVVANGKGTAPRKPAASGKKAKKDDFIVSSGEESDDEPVVKKKAPIAKKSPVKQQAKKNVAPSHSVDDESKSDTKPKGKPNWVAMAAKKAAGPSAPGSKTIPDHADPNCLAGLTFVFTGELSAFSRDEAIDIAKRFGGRVVLQPSSKTSYVVLGADAGPRKLEAIKKNKLKTLDEDEFLELISTRVPDEGDEKTQKKIAKEQEAIRQAAKEMERREKQAAKSSSNGPSVQVTNQLWTDRYAPRSLKEICGNKGQIEKLQLWLHDWPNSLKSGFKKPGKNGMNTSKAVLISGPPGIGKTTAAHLCAKLEGFTPIELNASDARSKKLVENSTNIANTSLDGWMNGGEATNVAGVKITDKTCLIMDEVDGMSAGDRGGVGALLQLIKKTKIPIICIANDKGSQKLKSLVSTAFNLPFRRPEAAAIRSRILSIIFKEKMKIPANVIDQLVTGAQSDIRQVLNMLSTWRLSNETMDFDESKGLVKMNEKHTILSPFDVTHKLLGPYLFSATSRETLGDKMELYFHDHSFMPLFIQENYLKTQPSKIKNEQGPERILAQLKLMDKAASSISDGDLVDSLIHGSEQHWSLMPLHAVCSTVRPASFLYGQGSGYGGPNAMCFPAWLGQNSKHNKLNRQLVDIHARMRLNISGDRMDIRQSYIPALTPHIVGQLMENGSSAIEGVIGKMDDYYLNRDDWDAIVELGLDQWKDELVLKKIPGATKAAFTRKYNSQSHPIAFHKATDLGKLPQKLAGAPAPDLEEAYDVDEEEEEAPKKVIDEDDVTQDSMIKAAKKGGAAAKGSKAKPKPAGKAKTR
ncbi:DNA replication factor C large subunit [Cristinia sonorae]|uniref:Replication factor C subunit 1 n=1 Tax=Cristinia sonorae TaxID=1940300 RepID=A0A8K0UVI5_9AGAR|nr:DNA replication factor C large subunit [Cristinia sonorae]